MLRLLSSAFAVFALLGHHLASSTPAVGQTPLRDLNSHCPFHPPQSLEAWQARASELRLQLEVSLGLFPKLELDPVRPQIYGAVERDNYTIEKVTFESLPGFFVTGNLYRPKTIPDGKQIPGVLCPHGHWTEARFYDANEKEVHDLLATGAERFKNAARNHIQARCVQLARLGCVVFHWDMIGYCDSTQISFERAHKFASQDDASDNSDAGWLLFSPLAESHSQSILGLQSLATQRAVDMLLTLPEIDPNRIAITGASGGGTQSFLGAALDDRIQVAFPAVMVSTGMQGGCTCENAALLRTGTGNVEIAGLIAPRPLGMTAADDWTAHMQTDGFPELQKLYALHDASKKVALFPGLHFGHNFNHVSRVSMYGWMNDHLSLGFDTPILEQDFELAHRDELSVWDAEHPRPDGGEDVERRLMKLWAEITDAQMQGMLRGDRSQVAQLSDVLRDGWRVLLGLTSFPESELQVTLGQDGNLHFASNHDGNWILAGGEKEAHTPGQVAIRIGTDDSAIAYHFAVAQEPQRLVPNPRLAAAYTYGYNLPEISKTSRRLGHALSHLMQAYPDKTITISGSEQAALLAVAAGFTAQQLTKANGKSNPSVATLAFSLKHSAFDFAEAKTIRDATFLPGSLRFWGLPGLAACLRDTEISTSGSKAAEYTKLERLFNANQCRLRLD